MRTVKAWVRLAWLGVAALLLVAALAPHLQSKDVLAQLDDDEADRVAAATVLIVAVVVRNEDGIPVEEYYRAPLGSGVLVSDDGLIVTNSHVVDLIDLTNDIEMTENEMGVDLEIETEFVIYVVDDDADDPYPRFAATVVKERATPDLAVLKIIGDERGRPLRADALGRQPLMLAQPETIQRRDTIQVFGYPVFGTAEFTTIDDITLDVVSSEIRGIDDAPGVGNLGSIRVDATLAPGSSGSAVVNDDGDLIGVIAEVRVGAGGGVPIAIPVNQVRAFLRSAGWVEPTPMLTATATISPTATSVMPEVSPTAPPTLQPTPTSTPTPPTPTVAPPTATPAPPTATPQPPTATPAPPTPTPTPTPASSEGTSRECKPNTDIPAELDFVEDFDASTCVVADGADGASIADGQFTVTLNNGQFKDFEFTRARTEGRNFALDANIAGYQGWGMVVLTLKTVPAETNWLFAVDPSELEWSLLRNDTGTNRLETVIPPQEFLTLVKDYVREIEVRLINGEPILLINGVDVVTPRGVDMPQMNGNYTVKFGAGVRGTQGKSFTVTFDRLRLTELS